MLFRYLFIFNSNDTIAISIEYSFYSTFFVSLKSEKIISYLIGG